jgi:glutathione S-transferase
MNSVTAPMKPTITAFKRRPIAAGAWRATCACAGRSRKWGQPYEVQLVTFPEMKAPAHRARHPFGQIPTYEEGDLVLFETGAIVLHIAQSHPGLLPDDANGRARAITWMFSALSTVEQSIVELQFVMFTERDKSWYEERLAMVHDRIRARLAELSERLGDADWLDGAFSAGDLMMAVLLGSGARACWTNIPTSPPAYQGELAVFNGLGPAGRGDIPRLGWPPMSRSAGSGSIRPIRPELYQRAFAEQLARLQRMSKPSAMGEESNPWPYRFSSVGSPPWAVMLMLSARSTA